MGKRTKLEKFAENQLLDNVFENFSYDDPSLYVHAHEKVDYRGQWKNNFFKNDKPLILELACGRGEYSNGMAQINPQRNYIGVDVKGARIWTGAKIATENKSHQVAFIRSKIEVLPHFFGEQEVDGIWIIFPDPFLGKANRRLTSPYYLDTYLNYIHDNAILHLKTDDNTLYEYSLKTIQAHYDYEITYHQDDIYSSELYTPELEIKTYYERMHLANGKKIKYIQFSRKK